MASKALLCSRHTVCAAFPLPGHKIIVEGDGQVRAKHVLVVPDHFLVLPVPRSDLAHNLPVVGVDVCVLFLGFL